MSKATDLKAKFWKSIKSDMTLMIGLDGVKDAFPRPMTVDAAQRVDFNVPGAIDLCHVVA